MACILAEALSLVYENPGLDSAPGEENPTRDMIDMALRGEIHPALQAVADLSALVSTDPFLPRGDVPK